MAENVFEAVKQSVSTREAAEFYGCLLYTSCKKPMKRLWISSMEDSAIREGFANLRPGADYDGLRDAALCRTKADLSLIHI